MNKLPFVFFIAMIFEIMNINLALSQEKCGTMHLDENAHFHEHNHAFENWLRGKIQEKQESFTTLRAQDETVTIPVVIHVIHNGENLGNAVNIPLAQIQSQIDVLNRDFRRQNEDASQTLEIFRDVAADTEINFALAVRDPEGLPTTGIVRVQGTRATYTTRDVQLLSSISYWPSDQYLNIWVTDLGSGLLGFALFPVSNLAGMNVDRESNPRTDGVFIDYQYFGVGFNALPFSRGRTVTHEVGHYLGLRHIWGDGGCNVDDFCNDTPVMERSTSGCPSTPTFSCGSTDMNQNFMDYTDDVCMNLFTRCQRERMLTILENSPRRKSLLSSPALITPTIANLDLGIRRITQAFNNNCESELRPSIEIRNYGNQRITAAQIQMKVNGTVVETKSLSALSLDFQSILDVQFSTYQLPGVGKYDISFEILTVNGQIDQRQDNNLLTRSITYTLPKTGTFITTFEETHEWIFDPSSIISIVDAPNSNANNKAVRFGFFNSGEALGTTSLLQSPVIRVSPLSDPRLEFRYAYKHPTGNNAEALFVNISTDCGQTYPHENRVFSAYGNNLNTSSRTITGSFVPDGEVEWRTAIVNLRDYRNAGQIRIGFEGLNGLGNNLYIDNIQIETGPNPNHDIALSEIANYDLIACSNTTSADLLISNNGLATINGFNVSYRIDNQQLVQLSFPDISIPQFQNRVVPITINGLSTGKTSNISVMVSLRDAIDEVPDNNTKSVFIRYDETTVSVPNRNDLANNDWFDYQPLGKSGWQTTSDWHFAPLFNNPNLGENYWLVSPIISLDDLKEFAISFDLAYANRNNRNDELSVLLDINCRGTFEFEVFKRSGNQLSTAEYSNNWRPDVDDWEQIFVDLSSFVGVDDVRLAFVATNQNGSEIFLRKINLYNNKNVPAQTDLPFLVYPNPANGVVNVQFNLAETSSVSLRLVDMMGRIVYEGRFDNILNQSIPLYTSSENTGTYVLQVVGDDFNYAKKVIIWH